MPMGDRQTNNMLHLALDVWQSEVFFNSTVYPAGYFANGIMNANIEDVKKLLGMGNQMMALIQRMYHADKNELCVLLPQARAAVSAELDALRAYPPFSLTDRQEDEKLLATFFTASSADNIANPNSHVHDFIFRYLHSFVLAPWGIYHFLCAAWFFELDYLRRLKKRNETHFAIAVHDCFTSELFKKEMAELAHSDLEPFSLMPTLQSSYIFARNPKNEKEMVFVNRVFFDRVIDFYTYDLLNGLHCGHAPSKCLGCGKYFLTTNAHTPKYCDGLAPQDERYTCRQYGAKMQQKEQNKDHPVYHLFSTRTNTIRQHERRQKISHELREAAIAMAEEYRDAALFDNDYAADGYARDMELANLYTQAERRLADG